MKTDCLNNTPAVLLFDQRPDQAPAGWMIWNAPRPLNGTLCESGGGGTAWESDYINGCFYAAVDPEDDLADLWVQMNQDLNASILLFASEDQARPLLEVLCRDEASYVRESFQSMTASRVVSELIERLHGQTYSVLRDLLDAVVAPDSAAA